MGYRVKAIPSSGSESAGGIIEAIENEREGFIRGGTEGRSVHLVRLRIVEIVVTFHTRAETIYAFQVGFDIRAPAPLGPRVPALLYAGRGIDGETCRAIRLRRIYIVPECITRDTGIINLVKIVEF